jgi:hypothetical protein
MTSRRLFLVALLAMAVALLAWIPLKSQFWPQSAASSSDLIAGRNVNMVSGTKLPYGDPWLQRQNEPSIAVSTRNPLHLLAGANDYRTVDMPGDKSDELPGQDDKKSQAPREPWLGVFKSFDGGQTWITSLLPGYPQDPSKSYPLWGYQAAADPVVRAGTNGLFYYLGIAFNRVTKESVVFVSRFIDNNNREMNSIEKGDCIEYLDTKIIATGLSGKDGQEFIDKPWIAVEVPQNKNKTVTIDGQSIPSANVYLAYAVFTGEGSTLKSRIFFASSADCGESWSSPIQLSEGDYAYQGATIGVDPKGNGQIFVAWRRFGVKDDTKNNSIFIARSVNGGKKFNKVFEVASFYPFDQPSSGAMFRTNSYPTVTVDFSGRLYMAWSQRMGGPSANARIVISTSENGDKWSTPTPVEDLGAQGHQIMPSITFAAGKVMLVWYDQRRDISGRFNHKFIDDVAGETRHTLDVRITRADPDKNPRFELSKQISRYNYILQGYEGNYTVKQVQANYVNYPLFKDGSWPFMGDYIDIAPSPMFVMDNSGNWRYNSESSNAPVFHTAWTDNRDVRPPKSGNWKDYTPPYSLQDSFVSYNPCSDWKNTGMRNQNIYTSVITSGIVAGAPGNNKPLGTLGVTPKGERIPRAFVVFVKNMTDQIKCFRLKIGDKPKKGRASFLEFEDLNELDVEVSPWSSISRPVFVDSTEKKETARVDVVEIDAPNGKVITGGLESSVILNPDIQNPDIQNPDVPNPDIMNYEYHNPDIMNSRVNPDIMNPDIQNPDIMNPDIINPDIMNPDIMNPDIMNPDIMNPDIMNPDIMNPTIGDPSAGKFIDVIWDVRNAGNTSSTYAFKTLSAAADENGKLPLGIQAQLLIYRVYTTPAEYDTAGNPCNLGKQEHHELILNIINPDIMNPDIQNIDITSPDIQNPDIQNASFSLEPAGEAKVILRLWKPYNSSPGLVSALKTTQTWDFLSIANSFISYMSATAGNTTDRQAGIPTYPADSSVFMITTKTLASGKVGQAYSDYLTAAGGTKPYAWTIASL